MGVGKAGKKLFDNLEVIISGKKIILFDNDENQTSYKDMKIERPYYIQERNYIVLISIQKHNGIVKKQLEDLGYERNRILQYRGGDIDNWFSYDKEYRNNVLKTLNLNFT